MFGAILFGLLLVGAILGVGYVVVARRFHQTPEYQWRKRVFEHSTLLAERRRRLVAAAPDSPDHVLTQEHHRAKDATRTSVPLEKLMNQSGIGPGMVGLLRQSGIQDIPTVLRANLGAINGIGSQKASWLWAASRLILAECDADFESGRSAEGAAFAERMPSIRDAARKACNEYRRALAAIDAASAAHRDSERLATHVTLIGFLRDHVVVGLDAERIRRPFPTPEVQTSSSATPSSTSDDLLKELLQQSSPLPKVEPIRRHPQQDRLEAFTRFGVMVALADGRAAQSELRLVRTFLAELFGHEPDLLRRIDPLIELSTVAKPNVEHTIAEAKRLSGTQEELARLHSWATRIADASSGRNDRESTLLNRITDEWKIVAASPQPSRTVRSAEPLIISARAATSPTDPRTELGIPVDAEITVELVRRRYTFVVDQLDAARLDGLGEEFTKLAAIKRENVEAAANALLRPLGSPLAPPAEPPPPTDLRHNPDLDAVFGA